MGDRGPVGAGAYLFELGCELLLSYLIEFYRFEVFDEDVVEVVEQREGGLGQLRLGREGHPCERGGSGFAVLGAGMSDCC